jgi:hypothetical protein
MIQFARLSILVSVVGLSAFAACGDNGDDGGEDNDAFPTYQACFDEHHNVEAFDTQKAITICCLDHPIGSSPMGVVCGADATSCDTYVTANLAGSDATATDVTAACTDYVTQKGM